MPRLAANLSLLYTEHPFLDRPGAAARDGFAAVEWQFPYEHGAAALRARLDAAGLPLVLMNAPAGDWARGERGMACLEDRQDEFRRSVDEALAYAQALRCPRLHVMAGCVPSGGERAALQGLYVERLAWAAAQAASVGVTVLIEPINGRDMPGYFLNHFSFAADLIAEMTLPNLKLQYDIYHRQILHGDVLKSLEALLPVTGHVQVASVPKRHEPGTGELDDQRIFHHLDSLGYDGYVGCEYRPAAGTLEGLGWMNRA